MKHPEFFLVPAFMLADYFLTLAGAARKEKRHGDHFNIEHYELNPIWQRHVAQRKWFNPRHIVLTVAVTSLLIPLVEFGAMPEFLLSGLLGCLLVFFGMVIGRHVSNLMTFEHLIRQPDEISGQVTMTHALLLWLSLYQYVAVIVPLALIGLFAPSPFVAGAMFASVLLLMVHLRWIRRHRREAKTSDKHG